MGRSSGVVGRNCPRLVHRSWLTLKRRHIRPKDTQVPNRNFKSGHRGDRTRAALRFHRNQPERNASNPRPRCILPRMPSRGPRGGPGVLSFAGAACSPAWVDNLDTRHDRPVDHEPNDPPPEKKRSLHTCRRPAKPWSPTDQNGLSFERPGASVTRLNERTTSAPNAAIISRLPWR